EVCQIGFGSGETARIFSSYDVDRFDCIEISRVMLEMADSYFRDINGGVLERDNFNAIIMDAAAYLRYADRHYDIIANDATWPSQAGPAMLFTLEYFQNGRDRLKPGGIMTSWLPLDMPLQDIKTILRTFHEVFPHVYVWSALSHRNKHALIAGSDRPLRIDAARFLERFDRFARQDLAEVYLDDPAVFHACHLSKVEGPAEDLADAPLSTEYSPALKFMHSRLYRRRNMLADTYRLLAARRDSILDHLTNLGFLDDPERFREKIERLNAANGHIMRALTAADQSPRLRDTEMAAAVALAPEHPISLLAAEGRRAMAARTPDEIRALALPDLKDTARRLIREGLYDSALIAMGEWALREPASAAPHVGAGTCYMLRGRFNEAIENLLVAERLEPGSPDVHFNLGVAYMRTNRMQRCIGHLRKAVDLAPGSAEVHAHLGTAYGLVGDHVGALRHLGRAVALDPDLPDAQRNLGILRLRSGNVQEAIRHLERSAALEPGSAQTHQFLGEAHRRAGNQARAERHLNRAAELRAGAAGRAGP
ncbi:MAG: tetratricopeptide repeat protein, partial [Candidatus Brocadiae bacterium]|nr:tetratricopeptide repeat protein [Candidatus Brocadiia bacterium]